MSTPHEVVLIPESGISKDEPFVLSGRAEVIGSAPRSASKHIVIQNPFVSREHAEIRFVDGKFHVLDLGSKNGTYVNGEQLERSQPHVLKDGDVIGLAEDAVLLRFRDPMNPTGLIDVNTRTLPPRPPDPSSDEVFVDAKTRDVWIRGKVLEPPLSRLQFDVLQFLYERNGIAVKRDDIADAGWPDRHGAVSESEIETCIKRIRDVIERDPKKHELLVTRRGFGYIMRLPR